MITFNAIIRQKRIEKNISIKTAAKELGIFKWLLKSYEQGYYKIPKKHFKKLCDFYEIDPNSIEDEALIYWTVYEEKNEKILKKVSKKSKIIWLVSLVILLAACITSTFFYVDSRSNVTRYYSDEYRNIVNYITTNQTTDYDDSNEPSVDDSIDEEVIPDEDLEPDILPDEGGDSDLEPGIDPDLDIDEETLDIIMTLLSFIYSSESPTSDVKAVTSYNNYTLVLGSNPNTEKAISIDLRLIKIDETSCWSVEITQAARSKTATVCLTYQDLLDTTNSYKVNFESSFSDYSVGYLHEEQEIYREETQRIYLEAISIANQILNDNIDSSYSVSSIFIAQRNGFSNYASWYFILFGMVLFFPICILILLFLVVKKYFIDKKKDYDNYPDNPLESSSHPLPKKNIFFPVFHERILRVVGILFLFVASITPFVNFMLSESDGVTEKLANIKMVLQFAHSGLSIAVLLLFFIKIDVSIRKKDLLNMVITFFFCGVAFYYGTILTTIHFNIYKLGKLLDLIKELLPGNIFFGLSSYALIAYFLFETPKKIAQDKNKRVLFRLCALIPIAYLAFSNLGIPHINIQTRYYLLFYPKTFIPSLFAILYMLSIYFHNLFVQRKYRSNAQIYINGKRYYMQKNIIAVSIIILLSILDFSLHKSGIGLSLFNGKFFYMCIVIPFVLFYQPRIEERSKLEDRLYGTSYALSFGSSYICFIVYIIVILNSSILDLITWIIWVLNYF